MLLSRYNHNHGSHYGPLSLNGLNDLTAAVAFYIAIVRICFVGRSCRDRAFFSLGLMLVGDICDFCFVSSPDATI